MEGLGALDGVAEVRGRGLMVGASLEDGLDAADGRARGPWTPGWWSTFPARGCCASCRR